MALFGRPTAEDQQRADAWRSWIQSRNPLAIASLVLGIFSLIEFGALLVFGIAGIALGIAALVQLRRVREDSSRPRPTPHEEPPPPPQPLAYESPKLDIPKVHGHALAWIGIALSAASLVVAARLYFAPQLRPW